MSENTANADVVVLIGNMAFTFKNTTTEHMRACMKTVVETHSIFEHHEEETDKRTVLKVPDGVPVTIMPLPLFQRMQADAKEAAVRASLQQNGIVRRI